MNVGENKGRRLRFSLARFAAMLIGEARDITGLTFAELDEKLGLPDGQSYRYSLYPIENKTRSPQAAQIQELECRVAKLLQRLAHTVVVENNEKTEINGEYIWTNTVEGRPGSGLNFRHLNAKSLQLGYEGDWPTYRRLKTDKFLRYGDAATISDLVKHGAHGEWPEMLRLYSWQWGILWDRGIPWLSRDFYGIPSDQPVEVFLPIIAKNTQQMRARFSIIPVPLSEPS